MLKSRIMILMLLSILFSLRANAQTNSTATSTTKTPIAKPIEPGWSLGLGLEYSENVAQAETGPKDSGMELAVTPGYVINEKFSLAGEFSITQASTEEKKPMSSNTVAHLNMKGWDLTNSIKSVHRLTVVLPTSQTSREVDKLYSAIGISNGFKMTLNPKFEMTYRLGLTRNFHEFQINAVGSKTVEYRLSNSIAMKLMLSESLNLTATGVYRLGRTYQGFQRSDFQFHGDINYDILENLSANIGTSNEGAALKANGVDSNISVYDEKSTVWRVGLSTSI